MWLGIITVLPELVESARSGGVFARALEAGSLQLQIFNPRDFAQDKHRTVDDRPYGGGAGMVMMTAPLVAALEAARTAAPGTAKVVLMDPQGEVFKQSKAVLESHTGSLIIVCGRYEGLDQRFVDRYIDERWSIGDYVLSGGELAALVVCDAIARHIPGTLGNSLSVFDESHLDGTLDYPHYTRPVDTAEGSVPDVLLSGDHKRIFEYRRREALQRTFQQRPDMLTRRVFSEADRKLLTACFAASKEEQNTTKKQ